MVISVAKIQDMIFYLGTHRPNHCKYFPKCFVSINVLRRRKSDFEVGDWIMDSGAFSELSRFGGYIHSIADYAQEINRWQTCGNLEVAVCQDYMCEPFMLERTGLTVIEHQRLTIERYDDLLPLVNVPIMPVLQGYSPDEYMRHLEVFGDRLEVNMRVGVGSICKRNSNPREVMRVLEGIKRLRPDLRLHGFGLKTTALKSNYICQMLYSADSMAWSYRARRNGGNANGLNEALIFYQEVVNAAGKKETQLELQH